jgi:hypothetical protein
MKRVAVVLVLLSVLAVGCGKDGDKESEGALAACASAMPADGSVTLPAGFPKPAKAAYVSASQAGPSTIIEGFYDGDIKDAYDAYKKALSTGAFSVTKDEKEDRDAEVFFGGTASNGQVNMFLECTGRTKLRITIRPL